MTHGELGKPTHRPYTRGRHLTLRARIFMTPALGLIHGRATREHRVKSNREMRLEGWCWRLCGESELADRFLQAGRR